MKKKQIVIGSILALAAAILVCAVILIYRYSKKDEDSRALTASAGRESMGVKHAKRNIEKITEVTKAKDEERRRAEEERLEAEAAKKAQAASKNGMIGAPEFCDRYERQGTQWAGLTRNES